MTDGQTDRRMWSAHNFHVRYHRWVIKYVVIYVYKLQGVYSNTSQLMYIKRINVTFYIITESKKSIIWLAVLCGCDG